MKKLLLLSAVLLGAVSASQAGVRFNLGVGIPLPSQVIIGAPAPPVYAQPAPQYYAAPPVCEPAPIVVVPPRIVVRPPVIDFRIHGYHRPYWQQWRDEYHHGHRW
jgi:hypothetical protein